MNKKQKRAKLASQKLVGIFDDLLSEETVEEIKPDIPEPREIPRAIIMFWRKEKCNKCHKTYEGSLYHSQPLLQVELQKPITHFGRMYGWRHAGVKFLPIENYACYDHLPHQIETVHTTVRICPRCIHTPKIIYLPQRTG